MLAPPITPANAKELQLKSALARKRNRDAARLAAVLATTKATTIDAKPPASPLEEKFARALEQTLDAYLACPDATERAKIARSMREVRETYHLYSGAPKPGTIKPERSRSTRQASGPGPELPPDKV